MTHRADQIVDAVTEAVRAVVPSSVKVFAHRRFSLEPDELPAISVDFNEDTPAGEPGAYDLAGNIQSLLTVNITSVAQAPLEDELRRELLQLRAFGHVGIRNVRNVGLPFVVGVHYGGANPPAIDTDSDILVGEVVAPWGVLYEMQDNTPE